ncbi:unnamed protein product [Timema podura]|uniref:Uncharacterized protein n=1 Tax=Timema podura TaxID=61482 RepID=A0ABN7P1M1_TIMPD|nr:unnamed protein product [Timema podura]
MKFGSSSSYGADLLVLPILNRQTYIVAYSSSLEINSVAQSPISDSGLFIGGLPVCGSEGDCEPNLKKLNLPCLEKITQASCCKNHILTVTETGNCWQYLTDTGTWKQISNFVATETCSSVRIVNVCCSETLNIALSESGMVYSIPVAISTPSTEKVVQVACGLEHCLLLTATGQVFSWGTGTRGQLGHGDLESECEPRPVATLGGLRVLRVAAGGWHSACITEEGDLYTFGWNSSGQLGLPTQTHGDKRMKLSDQESVVTLTAVPVPVTWKEREVFVIDVACGSRHTLALLECLRKPYRIKRRVEDLLEDHKQEEWTKRRRTWRIKEWTEDVWLRVKFGEIDRNERGFARQPAEAEVE